MYIYENCFIPLKQIYHMGFGVFSLLILFWLFNASQRPTHFTYLICNPDISISLQGMNKYLI